MGYAPPYQKLLDNQHYPENTSELSTERMPLMDNCQNKAVKDNVERLIQTKGWFFPEFASAGEGKKFNKGKFNLLWSDYISKL